MTCSQSKTGKNHRVLRGKNLGFGGKFRFVDAMLTREQRVTPCSANTYSVRFLSRSCPIFVPIVTGHGAQSSSLPRLQGRKNDAKMTPGVRIPGRYLVRYVAPLRVWSRVTSRVSQGLTQGSVKG